MRCGFDGLAAKVQTVLEKDPFCGHIFVFRGKRGDLIKCLYWRDGGLCLFSPNAWSVAALRGRVLMAALSLLAGAQLALLLEGFDWRYPIDAARPRSAL